MSNSIDDLFESAGIPVAVGGHPSSSATGANDGNGPGFEQAMEALERIVASLESGDVPLEQAIELYQQGMQLSRLCGEKLDQIEQKIEMLVEQDGQLVKRPFPNDKGDVL